MFYLNNCKNNNDLTTEFDNFFKNNFFGNSLKADLEEYDKNYVLNVDVPGVDKKDIKINFEDGYLTISINQKYEHENKKKYIVRERGYSEVSRSFYLEDADAESIKAKLSDGVLVLNIAKVAKIDNKKVIAID